jgi:hypothetical protein
LALGWLAAIPRPAAACGPFFPNSILEAGDRSVLAPPETVFSVEVHKLAPLTGTNRSGLGYEPWQTLKAELSDLKQALDKAGLAAGERETILARHLGERQRISVFAYFDKEALEAEPGPPWGGAAFALRPDPTNNTRIQGAQPQTTPGLPGEFADYFRGSIAWHAGDSPGARSAWLGLLGRPPAERHYKSTWAAFMLGKSWEEENRSQAIAYFQKVRELVKLGFADSLDLRTASLGQEARLQWREGRCAEAIELYLDQEAAGDASAELSLRFVASGALERGSPALRPLARHPRARALVTAYVVSGGYRKDPIDVDNALKEAGLRAWEKASTKTTLLPAPKANWHSMRRPVLLWLEAVERAGVKDLQSAELLALAAYQAAEFDTARRWLRRAQATPLTEWLQAKLYLHDGRVDEAAALLAKVCRHFPLEAPGTNAPAKTGHPDVFLVSTYADFNGAGIITAAEQTRAELGVFRLARGQFVEALDLLLRSASEYWMDTNLTRMMGEWVPFRSSPDYWMDAAYVAERVLTLDELKAYVDREWPAPAHPSAEAEVDAAGRSRKLEIRNPNSQTNSSDRKWGRSETEGGENRSQAADNFDDSSSNTITDETVREPLFRRHSPGEMIRYLLARRLARAWRMAEAVPYYPPEWRSQFDRLLSSWREAERPDLSQMDQGRALLQAAFQARKYGLELLGTEVEPDWRIHAGDFEEGVTVAGRAGLQASNYLAASREELERGARHATVPEARWHYRRTAAVIAWEAARMMRDARIPGQPPEERARALFSAGQLLRDSDVGLVAFYNYSSQRFAEPEATNVTQGSRTYFAPERYLVGQETPAEGSLADRLNRQAAVFFTIPSAEAGLSWLKTNHLRPDILWRGGYTTAALAWEAAQLLPDNSDETARVLCLGGRWIKWDPPVADLLYKSLVRRCRKTAVGAEADRIHWFPRIDAEGRLLPPEPPSPPPAEEPAQ